MTTNRKNTLVIASRGSRLALKQSEIVSSLLERAHPGIGIEVLKVKTTGDKDDRPFSQMGAKGVFTTEVERAVVDGRADVAVHSAKDLTAALLEGCRIVCVPPREMVNDVVVGSEGETGEQRLASLPNGARVGTSSIRRRSLMSEMRTDVEVVEFRGNLDTRLRKVAEGEVDAAILAAAGIARLGAEADAAPLEPGRWVPAPGQGALAVEALVDREDVAELFVGLGDPQAAAEIACERAFAERLEGGCSIPLGCLARAEPARLVVNGYLGTPDGQSIRDRISGSADEPERLGVQLAEAILDSGGDEILADLLELDEDDSPQPAAP